jgi:hypothetical protein
MGTYYHPGYSNITLEVAGPVMGKGCAKRLVGSRLDATWKMDLDGHLASSDHWLIYFDMHDVKTNMLSEFAGAQFKIGPDGRVQSLGVEFRYPAENLLEGLIWFA